jgi:predicted transcriptional regulator
MKVAELMHNHVQTVRFDATLAELVETLSDGHITGVPVVDSHGKMLGVVSTTDVLEAQAESIAGKASWEDRMVADVMTRPPLTIGEDADVHEAAQRMLYAEVHRLFVEKNGELVGVISQTDIVRALAAQRLPA